MKSMIAITKTWPVLCFVLALVSGFSTAYAQSIDGKILFVIDGDTYQIIHAGAPQGEKVRARHFDTPEKGDLAQCAAEREKAGQASAFARRLLPRGVPVVLSELGRDRYGRLLARVSLADGTDIAAQLIGAGLAKPYEGGRKQGWCAPGGAP
ncbi:MAG: thermonuclease family protein [Magnetospirillum sp.]|nr:thermonuclease family protein [Magnetospirillum sp.]